MFFALGFSSLSPIPQIESCAKTLLDIKWKITSDVTLEDFWKLEPDFSKSIDFKLPLPFMKDAHALMNSLIRVGQPVWSQFIRPMMSEYVADIEKKQLQEEEAQRKK